MPMTHSLLRTRITLFSLALMAVAPSLKPKDAQASGVQGDLRILDIESRVFSNTRSLRVWLPDDYDDPADRGRRFPVLYLNDGQDLFDATTAVLGSQEWRVDETAAELIRENRIPPLIIVGIDNAGRAGRAREYLPYPDDSLRPPEPSPQGRLYASFLESEVIPFIERRFRVQRGRASRALGGSSYGALVTLHVAVTRPELFSRLILESPSFYVNDNRVLLDAAASKLNLDRVYMGVGTNELALEGCPEHPISLEAVAGVRRLSDILLDKGMQADRLHVLIESCAEHTQAAWAGRFPAALGFLYGADLSP